MLNRLIFLILFSFFILLTACQTSEPVEVTRLVEVERDTTPTVVTRVVHDVIVETSVVTEAVTAEVRVTEIVPVAETVVVTPFPSGTEENPIQVVIAETLPAGIINGRGNLLIQTLTEMTDYYYELVVVEDLNTAVSMICANPAHTVAFLPAVHTVKAMDDCDAQPLLVGEKFDVPWHAGMFTTLNRAGFNTDVGLEAMSEAEIPPITWGIASETLVANTLLARQEIENAGIPISETITYGTDSNALLALLEGDVDMVTVTFAPPMKPSTEPAWTYGVDNSEVWRRLGLAPERSGFGQIEIRGGPNSNGYRIRDARAILFDTNRTIFRDTRIVALTQPVPNGAVIVGAEMPVSIVNQIASILTTYSQSEACLQSICSPDFYGWSQLLPITMDAYDPIRSLELSEELLATIDPEF